MAREARRLIFKSTLGLPFQSQLITKETLALFLRPGG
jgi:hypothetical protein